MSEEKNRKLKFYVDDLRSAPKGYILVRSVNEFLKNWYNDPNFDLYIDTISLDYDAGEYFKDGGDYIKILDYMDEMFVSMFKDHGWNYDIKFHFHSGNPTGVANMRRIIEKNGWKEIKSLD